MAIQAQRRHKKRKRLSQKMLVIVAVVLIVLAIMIIWILSSLGFIPNFWAVISSIVVTALAALFTLLQALHLFFPPDKHEPPEAIEHAFPPSYTSIIPTPSPRVPPIMVRPPETQLLSTPSLPPDNATHHEMPDIPPPVASRIIQQRESLVKDERISTSNHSKSLLIGAQMRLARQNKGLSLTEMATRVRYTKNYLSSIENDLRKPSRSLIETYERELGLKQGELTRHLETRSTSADLKSSSEELVSKRTPQEDRGEAPAVTGFYGRQQEIAHLKQCIVAEHCQMLAVLGFGGIGKTTLVASLLDEIQGEFEYVFWRSLQNAPPLESILRSCMLFLSDQRQTDLPKDLNEQLLLLIHYLREHRCLLVLDNLESILQSGERTGQYREEHWGYGLLLQRIGEAKHQSCLILTSREKPREILLLEGKVRPVRSMQLGGMELSDAINILVNEGFSPSPELNRLIAYYNGNPLALKLATEPIRELYQGDITTFLREEAAAVGNMDELIAEQFARLSGTEQQIMYWLSIEREAVSPDELREDILSPISRVELLDALSSLRRRFMIETKDTALFWLQPVIMEYVTSRLVKCIHEEILSEALHLLAQYALLKADAKQYVRESQRRLILAPLTNLLLRNLGEESFQEKLRNILATQRQLHSQTPNYVAGNVLNLLVHLNPNLSGYDFSHLYVWQAYLQGVSLRGVNFSYANLARSVFTDTFGSVFSVALSFRGDRLAAGTAGGEVRLWDTASATPMYIFRGHSQWIRSVAFDPIGDLIASGSEDETVRLWDTHTGRCLHILLGHTSRIYSVAFSPDGRFLASGGDDHTIRFWDIHTGECTKVLQGHDSTIYTVAFSPDGRFLASGGQDALVYLWDVSTGKCVGVFRGHMGRIRAVAFSPDSDTLASGSEDFTVRLWDVSSARCFKVLDKHTKQVWSVAFNAEGDIIASGSDDHTIRLWDAGTGESMKTLQGQEGYGSRVYTLAFNSDKNIWRRNILASGSDDQTIRVWDADTGDCIKTLQGYSSRVYSIAFHPNGSVLASGSEDKAVRLWNLHTHACSETLRGHTHWIWSVAFSPSGNVLATASEDWTLRLWNISSGEVKVLKGYNHRVYSVSFSLDGRFVASGSGDQTVKVWDVNTGMCTRTFEGHHGSVYSVAFSPNGTILASGGDDEFIYLWDLSTGQLIRTFTSNTSYAVAFSPDGLTIASGGPDGVIRLWHTDTGAILETLRSTRPYEEMNITRIRGLTMGQKVMLKALGAIEKESQGD